MTNKLTPEERLRRHTCRQRALRAAKIEKLENRVRELEQEQDELRRVADAAKKWRDVADKCDLVPSDKRTVDMMYELHTTENGLRAALDALEAVERLKEVREAQRKRIVEWQRLAAAGGNIARLTAENKELREALVPFADWHNELVGFEWFDKSEYSQAILIRPIKAELERAAALVDKGE